MTPSGIDPNALLHGGVTSGSAGPIGMVVLLTLVTLLPAIVLSCTCFVRFIVVLGFVRTGLGTASAPPNQVLVGLALFMAVFVSAPVAMKMYDKGGKPYFDGQMSESAAIEAALPPLREFLIKHTGDSDLELFLDASGSSRPATIDDVPMRALIPAFIVSELRTAFKIGLTILLPFLVIDLVSATVLTSLGMVMVPPSIVSLPAKLLIFVMIDGWHVVVESLLRGVRG
ncbi:MAG TPA: flagellar type III secretion system pore protein FliP [Kofleriaceae bacterium]